MTILRELYRALSFALVFWATFYYFSNLSGYFGLPLPDTNIGMAMALIFVVGGLGHAHTHLVRNKVLNCSRCGYHAMQEVWDGVCLDCQRKQLQERNDAKKKVVPEHETQEKG